MGLKHSHSSACGNSTILLSGEYPSYDIEIRRNIFNKGEADDLSHISVRSQAWTPVASEAFSDLYLHTLSEQALSSGNQESTVVCDHLNLAMLFDDRSFEISH